MDKLFQTIGIKHIKDISDSLFRKLTTKNRTLEKMQNSGTRVARKISMKTAWNDLKQWMLMWGSFAAFVGFQAAFIYGLFNFFGQL